MSCIVCDIFVIVVEMDVRDFDNLVREVCNFEFFCFNLIIFVLFDVLDFLLWCYEIDFLGLLEEWLFLFFLL